MFLECAHPAFLTAQLFLLKGSTSFVLGMAYTLCKYGKYIPLLHTNLLFKLKLKTPP